jgi:protein-L-isoaspartate(D-aspartate) O-methyltransferase
LPPALLDYLNIGGRLFAVIGDAPVMKATVFTRSDALSFQSNEIFETVLAPLVNAVQPSRFTF